MRDGTAAPARPDGRAARVCLVGLLVANAPRGSGVPRYAAQLTRALDEVAGEFPGLHLSLLTTAEGAEVAAPSRLEVVLPGTAFGRLRSAPARLLAEHLAAAGRRADLLHFFDLSGPVLRPGRRFTTTVLDASIAHGFQSVRHAYKRRLYPWALHRAARVVAISEFAKEEARRHFGVPAEQVTVVRPGPGLMTASDGAGPGRSGAPFLLYVGDLTPK